ncbi:hypothetical protein C8R46DRAFT_1153847 [Mycena filopes]|nr:hypothetical protein C8R46DRAFT_1153847 [Mycena filopes]
MPPADALVKTTSRSRKDDLGPSQVTRLLPVLCLGADGEMEKKRQSIQPEDDAPNKRRRVTDRNGRPHDRRGAPSQQLQKLLVKTFRDKPTSTPTARVLKTYRTAEEPHSKARGTGRRNVKVNTVLPKELQWFNSRLPRVATRNVGLDSTSNGGLITGSVTRISIRRDRDSNIRMAAEAFLGALQRGPRTSSDSGAQIYYLCCGESRRPYMFGPEHATIGAEPYPRIVQSGFPATNVDLMSEILLAQAFVNRGLVNVVAFLNPGTLLKDQTTATADPMLTDQFAQALVQLSDALVTVIIFSDYRDLHLLEYGRQPQIHQLPVILNGNYFEVELVGRTASMKQKAQSRTNNP